MLYISRVGQELNHDKRSHGIIDLLPFPVHRILLAVDLRSGYVSAIQILGKGCG